VQDAPAMLDGSTVKNASSTTDARLTARMVTYPCTLVGAQLRVPYLAPRFSLVTASAVAVYSSDRWLGNYPFLDRWLERRLRPYQAYRRP
jgi:hypothetical protein